MPNKTHVRFKADYISGLKTQQRRSRSWKSRYI